MTRDAQMPRPLAEQLADAARGGMHEESVSPSFTGATRCSRRLGAHALQHHRRGEPVGDFVRQRHDQVRLHGANLGIGAGRWAGISNAVARHQPMHAGPYVEHDAGGFHAGNARWLNQRVIAGAGVDIDIVEADRRVPDPRLARTGRHRRRALPAQDFRAAMAVEDDGAAIQRAMVAHRRHGTVVAWCRGVHSARLGRTSTRLDRRSPPRRCPRPPDLRARRRGLRALRSSTTTPNRSGCRR